MSRDAQDYYRHYWSELGFRPLGAPDPGALALLDPYVGPGTKLLDLGCGDGRALGAWTSDRGAQYTGVDVSTTAIGRAQAQGLDCRAIESASALPFPSCSFDLVACLEVLEHLFLPQEAAAEALRVLRPGGLFVVTVPNVAYWRRRADLLLLGRWNPLGDDRAVSEPWRDPHLRFFTPATLLYMLQEVGFSPVRGGGHGGALLRDLPWVGRALGKSPRVLYRALERRFPGLLAYRAHAVVRKPD